MMKRLYQSLLWLISIHIAGLLGFSLFRFIEFVCLHGQIVHSEANIFGAFIRGVWFDNVIACYILIVPLVLVGIAAIIGRIVWFTDLLLGGSVFSIPWRLWYRPPTPLTLLISLKISIQAFSYGLDIPLQRQVCYLRKKAIGCIFFYTLYWLEGLRGRYLN